MVIDYAISTLVTVGLFLISIAAHELGHLLVGRFLGYTSTGVTVGWGPGISFYMKGLPVRVGIIPGGGYTEFPEVFEHGSPYLLQRFLIASGGPFTSLLAAACFMMLVSLGGELVWLWETMGIINVLIVVLNMLPIPPLDGWRMLEAMLEAMGFQVWACEKSQQRGYAVGFIVALGFTFALIIFS